MENKKNKWIISSSDMSELFQVSQRQLKNWVDAGCPKLARGKWNLKDVIAWRSGNFVTSEDVDQEELRKRQLIATTIYREEKAKREKLQREAFEGRFVPYEDMANAWASRVVEVKSGLLNWVKSLPPQLAQQDEGVVEERLDIEVRDLLDQYYRTGTYTPKMDR